MGTAITGFDQLEEIHRSSKSLVLRGVRASDGLRVVLKTTSERHPLGSQIQTFARERRLATQAQGDHVVRLHDAFDHDGAPVLVLEDFGGRSLDLLRDELGLAERARLAISVARAVEAVHARGVIHKDVNPSNLVFNPANGTLKLVDFGIATDLKRETPSPQGAHVLEGTIQYIAPEQTGRMSASVDRRSDLYSVGATLYQLFSGRRPFDGDDPLELVHAHLARVPMPLHEVAPNVPLAISAIVMRLLEKDPGERYQTASGLVADLERCADELQREGSIRAFELGQADRSGTIEVPQKLYGRAGQVKALLSAFDRAAGGGRELVLVSGSPGIGKTSLVREVYKPIAASRGDFLEGKFDQFRVGVPYAPFGHAFGRFLRWVLSQDERALGAWRKKIADAVGANGAVLSEILPELARLIGPLERAQDLAATEAENRFHLVFRELVHVIATRDHPIALFLDDLQWADVPSLRLIESIVTDADSRYLMVIGAYRDSEVDAGHPLNIAIGNVRRGGVATTSIELAPLKERDVQVLVRETFLQKGPEIDELAALCARKTGGNPFFLRRFLESLGERGITVFYPSMQRWAWSLEEIESLEHTENVVSFLVDQLGDLPRSAQIALQQAACIGDSFDLRLLAESTGRTPDELEEDLRPALNAELVSIDGELESRRCRFTHDRIHQAAYKSMSDVEATKAHYRLGNLIAAQHVDGDEGGWLFEVVNHLDKAVSLAVSPGERAKLATQNLEAGRRAMRAAAFSRASEYLEAGISMLPEGAWTTHYELALGLHADAAACAYLEAKFEHMAIRIAAVKANAKTLLDGIQALEIEMEGRMAQGDLRGAVSIALQALGQLGWALPDDPGNDAVGAAVQRAMGVLAKIETRAIEALPDVADPVVAAAQRILVRACSPAYFSVPALLPILACELVVTSVEKGLSTATPFAFAVYGIVLNSIGMLTEAHEYGALAERLIDRWDDRHLEARTRLVVNNNVCTWTVPFQEKLDGLREAYRIGRDTGDFEYAALCGQSYSTNAFSAGRDLGKLLADAELFAAFMKNYAQSAILRLHQPLMQLVRNLLGASSDPARLDGPDMQEDEAIAFAESSGSASLAFVILSDVVVVRHHFGSARDAYAMAERARPYQPGAVSTYHLVNFHTYAPLAASSVFDSADEPEKSALVAKVDESIAQLEVWAAAGPMNHRHRLRLVQAERARMLGKTEEAATLFHEALEAARLTSYVNDEALISERCARFYLARGGVFESIGRAFLEDASFAYQRWGATAKVDRLREAFPRLIGSARTVFAATSTATTSSGLDIDAAAVLRAARTISSEIELDKLLETVFRTIVEAGGAQKALLLLERGGHWELAVEGAAASAPTLARKRVEELDVASYPLAVLRYVRRTGTDVLIEDATKPGTLMDGDAYARAHGARSVLCVPIQHRGDVTSVLYLEHTAAAGVFTAATSALVKLLMSQALVSINNAQLFEAQVRLTKAQRRFVPLQFLESLDRHDIADVALGDAVAKTMSVFFSDLRDFTSMVEDMEAGSVIKLLNDYFGAMEPHIVGAGGFIDSFNGDEIMALFDVAPANAVRAGVNMHAALERFNIVAKRELRMGIGINTGSVVLGTVGGRDRIKCGVVGDAVNVASRIEGLTKRYGARLLVGEATREALPPGSFSLRPIDRVAVKGRKCAETIFEVLDADPAAERAAKERSRAPLERAMAHYYARDFRAAADGFIECRELAPADRVPPIFVERCTRFEKAPPSEDWDGVDRLA